MIPLVLILIAGGALVMGGLVAMATAGVGMVARDQGFIRASRLDEAFDIFMYVFGVAMLLGGPALIIAFILGWR